MNKEIHILYIGNDLTQGSNYNSAMNTLSFLLSQEGFVVRKASHMRNKLIRMLHMCYAVGRHARKVDYVLIDTFSTKNFYYALVISQLCRLLGKRYISILHGGNLPSRLANNKFLSRLIFSNSYKNVAPSLYLKTHFDEAGYNTEFIPNTIEITKYSYKERTTISPRLLWVRAFDVTYNPQLAIKVLAQLKKNHPDAKLCMVGPDKDGSLEACKTLASDLELSSSVVFTGVLRKEEWHKLSEDYDIFINTTNIDNTPVSLIEAMALGLPIVSTNVGGIPFLVEDGKEAILVEKNNMEAMVSAILNVIDANDQNITKLARAKAESFDWMNVKTKWSLLLS